MNDQNLEKGELVKLHQITLLAVQESNKIEEGCPFQAMNEDDAIFNNNVMLGVYHQIRDYILSNCRKSYDRRKLLKDLKDLLKPPHDQWFNQSLFGGGYHKWSRLIEEALENFSEIVEQLPLEDLK